MKASVAYVSMFENVIEHKIVEVSKKCWKEAFNEAVKAGLIETDADLSEWLNDMSDDLAEARKSMCDGEMDISVLFID